MSRPKLRPIEDAFPFLEPGYTETGVFYDPCFWCGKDKCRKGHGLEIADYRVSLHFRAVDSLAKGLSLMYDMLPALVYRKHVEKLFALKPDQMGMEEHRRKKYYRQFSKSMSGDQAWLAAKKAADKEARRARFVFPHFSRQENQNIARYRPRRFGKVN